MPQPPRKSSRFGELERAVMDVLWSPSTEVDTKVTGDENPEQEDTSWWTVREVYARLVAERDIAYTTVMTVMDRLAKKDVVHQEKDGRAYRYRAVASRSAMTAGLMRETLSDLGQGSRESALVAFVTEASADDIAALKQALADLTRKA